MSLRVAPPRPGSPALTRAAPIAAVLGSMSGVQVGAALSVPLFGVFGVAGTTWLRLTFAAVALVAVARPGRLGRQHLPAALLGVVMAVNSVAFAAATQRIPLGVTVAVEFCGPLAVAAAGARGGGLRRTLWPVLALAGVLLLTRPWAIGGAGAATTWAGLGLAALAGAGWSLYIVLTAHVGRTSQGLTGLAVALAVAAVALAPFGAVQAWPALHGGRFGALAVAALAALLVPLGSYALEMAALRRLDQGVFGVWMALEPAIGLLAGLVMLGQQPALVQLPGFVLVVAAGVGAERASR